MTSDAIKGIIVAGLAGGSGKSVVAVGLAAWLAKSGARVISFKKGPDYIDAGWLSRATGHPCYNLDPYLMDGETVLSSFRNHAAGFDCCVVEGNRGLFDGVDARGSFSTAELAVQLGLPVLLVVNCTKTTRTVAALVKGCVEFDSRLTIAGVVLNQVATARQEAVIREAVREYTGIPVVGVMPRQKKDIFPMRHLGITPHQESDAADDAVDKLAALVENSFDVSALSSLMGEATVRPEVTVPPSRSGAYVRVGIIRDRAFQFYYEENLEALRREGAELVMIDALRAESLPDKLDCLYIGGGFPETSARELAANESFRLSVRRHAEKGLPIYAECGGLIFLGRSLVLEGHEYPLAGVFPVTFGISRKPQAHGYSIFRVERNNPFYPVGTTVRGHEFRYSTILDWQGDASELALRMERGTGFMARRDGLAKHNVLALYTHVLAPGVPQWAVGMVKAARGGSTAVK
jgi:cobyrinic acid a,c-diamide synthase